MKNKAEEIQIFAEVLTDYTDNETGEIAIDAYPDTDANSENARTVARVTPDGDVIKGTNPEVKPSDLDCRLVKEAIEEMKAEQKIRKQKRIDMVLEKIKEDVANGDVTAIDELLMFCPSTNLKGYLCEDNYEREIREK